MSKLGVLVRILEEKLHLTRRGFVKGAVALGATASMYGCSKGDGEGETVYVGGGSSDNGLSDDPYSQETALNPTYRYGTSAHNCGGRCIIKAQVVAGRIVRFLTDESKVAYDNTSVEEGNRNSSQSRACARCRAYKTRLYHPGRLKYPLKQTKKRGDLSGFVRVSWQEALQDIADRFNAVTTKYGPEAFHSIYACGNIYSPFQSGGYNGVLSVVCGNGAASGATPAIRLLGGATSFAADYSFHQYEFMGGYGIHYSGYDTGDGNMAGNISMTPSADAVAEVLSKIVLWGSNITSTVNPLANPWVKATQEMKKARPNSKVIFIGPEFSDTGVTIADEWVQIKPYTDSALILGMMYHMLTTNKLDINYIDSMVYGFFGSPEYWIHNTNGAIELNKPVVNVNDYTHVSAVPAGEALASYILGNGTLPAGMDALPAYGGSAGNYVARKLGGARVAPCSFSNKAGAGTIYATKRDFQTPKTVAWASNITGVPEATIIELAEFYANAAEDGQQIWNEWSGGQLKQAEGCNTLYMMQALNIIVGNWGITGAGIARGGIGRAQQNDPKGLDQSKFRPASWTTAPKAPNTPVPSVTMWHNAIKYAFGDQLKANGYVPNIPDWKTENVKTGNVYFDDGGIKSLVKRKYDADGNAETFDDGGKTYFKWYANDDTLVGTLAGGTGKTPLYSGFRFILNSSGNIPVNQHANSIDSVRMYEALPSYGYGAHQAEIAEAFYLVTFDNFMAPAARYSDYVLPAKTTWEQADVKDLFWGNNIYIDEVISGPGESKSTWDFTRDLILACKGEVSAKIFAPNLDSFRTHAIKTFTQDISRDANSTFKDKSWNEFIKHPFTTNKVDTKRITETKSAFRAAFETYKAAGYTEGAYPAFASDAKILTRDAKNLSFGGVGADQFTNSDECPNQSGRFHVYSGSLVWRYKNLFNKWHAHLPLEERGQNNKDREDDDIVYPIPMYFAYEDYFVDAYNLTSSSALNGRFLLTTTHDRYRAHSSQSENPYLRELTHRTVGGGLYSANDSGSYATSSNPKGDMNQFNNLNSLIDANGNGAADASYSEMWMNKSDASNMGIVDGSLLEVSNEIGKVRVVARLSDRCVKGFVGLHQGCWFDPRNIGGEIVDVGGNCNTLMASRPSRYDHGNAQQSAMVNIRKIR